ncbi:SelT-like protein [Trifolium pratense]|uniref:SelT-like protein n=1 Tax=Trifolium pratense TaxID=57577 RepID=A0A2K3MTX5_TRIPR|nr:SelT-like protein [Trifolium pratense]
MDRTQILLVGLPIFLFCTDIFNLFTTSPPPKSTHHNHNHPIPQPQQQSHLQQPLDFPTQKQNGIGPIGGVGPVGVGNTVSIDFCTSCSYKFVP